MNGTTRIALLAFGSSACVGTSGIAQTPGPAMQSVPVASVRVAPITVPVAGQCVTLTRQAFGVSVSAMYSLVSPDSAHAERRINVGVDSAGSVLVYSDVRSAADGYQVLMRKADGTGSVISRLSPGLIGTAPADALMQDAKLGSPKKIADEVVKRCGAPAK